MKNLSLDLGLLCELKVNADDKSMLNLFKMGPAKSLHEISNRTIMSMSIC